MLNQRFQLKLLQKLSPQQIQLMKLLQIPTANLEQRIKEELEANPALDEGEDHDDELADFEPEGDTAPEPETTDTETTEDSLDAEPDQEEDLKVEDDVYMSDYYD